ncbi:MAG: sugar ABC transporter permease [Planctomycetota bacterium]
MIGSTKKRVLIALLFLLPNLIGFLMFTAGPVLFSIAMSFTDWALTEHNQFSDEPVRFVGVQNYERLLVGDESRLFWDYFGNTVFLMAGIPIGIAGSLALAVMLHAKAGPSKLSGRLKGSMLTVVVGALACVGVWFVMTATSAAEPGVMSTEVGLGDIEATRVDEMRTSFAVLITAVLTAVVALGMAIGQVFFRTVFYLPSLLAGVAMFLLWKALYRPQGGMINAALDPVLEGIASLVSATPNLLWIGLGWATVLTGIGLFARGFLFGLDKLNSGDSTPIWFACRLVVYAALGVTVGWFGLLTVGLPGAVDAGEVRAPAWLIDATWAKTALIVMGVWLGIGGGNMLLYLAGLSNIPPELYEAAAIDGASGWQRFIHVTWPQLAPTTFFIVIMSTIGGLQGGFEQALVMTQGQADTIVLTYYLYNLAFTGNFELGLASAVAWIMFAIIFAMTAINFRYGSRMTND